MLVGDAFAFLDPVYSSGVFLALASGEFAADAIHEGLESGDVSGERLGGFGAKLIGGMGLIKRLVHVFYDRSFSFGRFNQEYPEYRDHIVRLLIGDVFNNEVGKMFDVIADQTCLPDPIKLDGLFENSARNASGAILEHPVVSAQGNVFHDRP